MGIRLPLLLILCLPTLSKAQYIKQPVPTNMWGAPTSASPIWGSTEVKSLHEYYDTIWHERQNTYQLTIERNYRQQLANTINNTERQQAAGNPIWNSQTDYWGYRNSIINATAQQIQVNNNAIQQARNLLRNSLTDTLGLQARSVSDSLLQASDSLNALNNNNVVYYLPPPPDDPIDVPIDNGLAILISIGLAIGYSNSKQSSKKVATKRGCLKTNFYGSLFSYGG
jgi:hypothetical protein